MAIYYCVACCKECKPEIYSARVFGFVTPEVVSRCCNAAVFTDDDRQHAVTVIELPEADRWFDGGAVAQGA